MGIGYWLLTIFMVLFLFSSDMTSRNAIQITELATGENQQRARQTVHYINLINDWLYDHPQDSGVISDSDLGFTPAPGLRHIIQGGRVFVWQPDNTGLMGTLLEITRGSALIGRNVNQRLIDNQRNDMQVTVPAVIPETSLVYLN